MMNFKSLRMIGLSTVFSTGLLIGMGCDGNVESETPNGTPVDVSGPGPGGGPGRPGRRSSPIRAIMGKLDRGPNALNKAIGKGLEADPPDWGTLQKQSSEYASLATDLGKHEPPKGSPESWAKLTAAFAASAADLDHASQAKDRDAALKSHDQLTGSCMECHKEHRRMPGGRGFGRPGGGPPGGGPPPQGGPEPPPSGKASP